MTVRRPLILVGGVLQEITTADTVDSAVLPSTSSAFAVDGGTATSVFSGILRIDYGAAT